MERNQHLEQAIAIGRQMLAANSAVASLALQRRLAALDRDVAETLPVADLHWRHGRMQLVYAGYVVDVDEKSCSKLATALARTVMREDGQTAASPA